MKKISFDSDLVPPLEKKQWDSFQQLITSLSITQMIWISGYLYNLVITSYNHGSNVLRTINSDRKIFDQASSVTSQEYITILFASQTGNAKKIAEKLYFSLLDEKFNVRLINVGDYNFKKIYREKFIFLITSTHGEGEPPEAAIMLYEYLFSKCPPNMKGVHFSIFGLGDRSYVHFSKAAKDFDSRLEELGGCRFYQRIDADLDYDQLASSWCIEIIHLLKRKKEFSIFNVAQENIVLRNSEKVINVTTDYSSMYSKVYTKEVPYCARLMVRQKITSRNAVKDVYHLEIDISGSDLYYQPGDALGIWYENDPNLVSEFLRYCNFTGKEEVNISNQLLPCRIVLQKYCELTHNTPLVAKNYANLINNKDLLSLFLDDNQLKKFVLSTSIVDMIRCWTPKRLVPKQLLSILRPLTPRFYSIASSQNEVGEEVHITVGVVRYEVDGYVRSGGATGYLTDRVSEGDELRVFIVPNSFFRLPNDSSKSIIMIAAGTGIAPFRSFMQERSSDGALGKNWLFFGNLCFLDDFLYQREWQKYVQDGLLTNIDTAWSRDQEHKIYVQDKILENGLEVWKWIQNGAHVYICGDAFRMARCVEKSLIQLGIKYGKMSAEESVLFWGQMRIQHRYQKDVY